MTGECYVHGPEPIPDNVYLVCGECGHAYATADELVAADRDVFVAYGGDDYVETSAERIYACPYCFHDF